MKPEDLLKWFFDEWRREGEEYAQRRFRQRLPFCPHLPSVSAVFSDTAEELRKLRRGCLLLIILGALAVVVSLPVILDPRVPTYLRVLYCLLSSAGVVMVKSLSAYLPRLSPQPLISALKCSLLSRCDNVSAEDSPLPAPSAD